MFVQLRLDPTLARVLRKAGEAQGRKLPAEILVRLRDSVGDQGPSSAVAKAVGVLAARIEKLTGNTSEAGVAALLKEGLPILLDRLGATWPGVTDDERAIAKALAKSLELAKWE